MLEEAFRAIFRALTIFAMESLYEAIQRPAPLGTRSNAHGGDLGPTGTPAIHFAPGSAELDVGARALLAKFVEEHGAHRLLCVTLDASYDPREAADAKAGRTLARARAREVHNGLENAGLSSSVFSRIGERDATVRIELPPRDA
jgi:hypothetical protein